VKIRDHALDKSEVASRAYEQARFALLSVYPTSFTHRQRFKHAHRRGSHRDDAAAFTQGASERRGGISRHHKALGVDNVVFDTFYANRLERPIAHVQRYFGSLDALCCQRIEQPGREMQPRRRRRNRAAVACVNGLITVAVGRLIAALDVWRQRDVPNPIDCIVDVDPLIGPETDSAAAMKMTCDDFPMKPRVVAFEDDARADVELLPRVHQRFPDLEVSRRDWRKFTDKQALNRSPAGNATAKKPRGKDPRVVEHEQIASSKVIAKLRENRVFDRPAFAMHHEQPGVTARSGRLLGDQLIGKVEVERSDIHYVAPAYALLSDTWTSSHTDGFAQSRARSTREAHRQAWRDDCSRVRVYDTVIIGGGPAGLSAALVLGRCRRHVLLCDVGMPRNARSSGLHGFVTRDGIAPLDLLRLGRTELDRYNVERRSTQVTDVDVRAEGFELTLADSSHVSSRTVLIACGVRDSLPDIPGLDDCFGISVHHCPYCDGWEWRDKALVVIGQRSNALGLALSLTTWSDRVTLCSNGPTRLPAAHREQLTRHGIQICQARITSVEHSGGRVQYLVLAGRDRMACDAIFVGTRQQLQSTLPRRLGCNVTRKGTVKTDHLGRTGVPGVYVAGDASRDVQFAIVAAAEGAKAAVAINTALQQRTGLIVD
jgi:thioredoxin reductase